MARGDGRQAGLGGVTMATPRAAPEQAAPGWHDLSGLLRCSRCLSGPLDAAPEGLRCRSCGAEHRVADGVLVMASPAAPLHDTGGGTHRRDACATAPREGVVEREREDWERNAEFYLREPRSPLFSLLHAAKRRTYALHRERRLVVLDLGGGTGYFSRELAAQGHVAVTLDFSARMLRLGREAYGLPLAMQCAVPPLPFADASLDAVVVNGVLHHCKAQDALAATVGEIHRALKPGGLLLAYDRNGAFLGRHLHHFVLRVKRALERRRRFGASSSGAEPDFNDADLRTLTDAGFAIERRRYVSTLWTFSAIVATNCVEYAGLPRLAQALRYLAWPLALASEWSAPFKAVTVEQCLRLRKT